MIWDEENEWVSIDGTDWPTAFVLGDANDRLVDVHAVEITAEGHPPAVCVVPVGLRRRCTFGVGDKSERRSWRASRRQGRLRLVATTFQSITGITSKLSIAPGSHRAALARGGSKRSGRRLGARDVATTGVAPIQPERVPAGRYGCGLRDRCHYVV